MARINLSGMGVALITPFKEDESIDFEALSRLIEYLIQNGTDYLVVLGTTAETPTLTEEEKTEIKKFVVERTKGRIPLVLGLGGNNTRGIIDHLKKDDFSFYRWFLIITSLPKREYISIIVQLLRRLNCRLFYIMFRGVPV